MRRGKFGFVDFIRLHLPALLLIFIVVFFYYRGFLNNYIGGDDISLYMDSPGGWQRVMSFFADIGRTYRPIPYSLFSVYRLFGNNVYGMHSIPLILHVINSFLVYLVLFRFSKSRVVSAVTTLVYTLSHVVFFYVYTLTGFTEQIYLAFTLTSLVAFFSFIDSGERKYWIMSWVFFILAMFSKESFVSGVIMVSVAAFMLKGKIEKSRRKVMLSYWIPTALYFTLKLSLLKYQPGAYTYVINVKVLAQNLLDYGLWLINWRHGWQMGMPYPPNSYFDLLSFCYLVVIVYAGYKLGREKSRLLLFAVVWGAVGLVPYYFLQRALPFYLGFSLIGLCLLIAVYLSSEKIRYRALAMVVIASFYFSSTIRKQWVEYSFSARGVQAAEKYHNQVTKKYDWGEVEALCLVGMDEYALWATGVGQEVNLGLVESIEIMIVENDNVDDCAEKNTVRIQYENEQYRRL